MAARVYATEAEYLAFTGEQAAPAKLDRLLRAASRVVDMMLLGVVYDVDPATKLPTDTDVAEALRDAVCVIAETAEHEGLLDPGATQQWESVAIGNIQLSTLQGGSASDTPKVGGLPVPPEAQLLLAEVGAFTVTR